MRNRSTQRALGLLFLVMATLASPARAGTLWYNGDYDNRDSLTNENSVPIVTGTSTYAFQKSLVYDNFVVPTGQTWTITNVYSNDLVAYYVAPTTATWAILKGVSAGSGGTVVASGDAAATLTTLSQVPGYYYGSYTPETVSVSVSVVLTAGTYWLAVAPDSAGYYNDQSYIMTTSGANSIGSPAGNDGNSYITNSYPATGAASYNFTPTTTALAGDGDGSKIDFSMGVVGTFAVPEPSSLVLVALGLIGSMGWVQRRRTALAR